MAKHKHLRHQRRELTSAELKVLMLTMDAMRHAKPLPIQLWDPVTKKFVSERKHKRKRS